MPEFAAPVFTIAAKDIKDALRDRFVLLITSFLVIASLVALSVAAITLKGDVSAYLDARATLVALGKDASSLPNPAFFPLKLLRGFIEYAEIVGAVIAILVGYRAAASERGRQTLALIATRPVAQWQLLLGKWLGGMAVMAAGLLVIFVIATLAASVISGVGLTADDLVRLGLTYLASVLYVSIFLAFGLASALWARKLPNALLLGFTVWLAIVLVAPQIGDTMDPDNQVAGGVFKQLHIDKPQQTEILSSFSTYETIRNGIEVASPTKHFERFAFAVLGIKDSYTGQPLMPILAEKTTDIQWLAAVALALCLMLFGRRIDPNKLSKD